MVPPTETPDDFDDEMAEDGEEGAEVLEFTPEDDAAIEDIADTVVGMMEEYGMDCDIHFPMFTMEVEHGATIEDIVEGYQDILDHLAAQMAEQPA
ncbi:MAG TPA: hypothetical protein PLW48_02330 [Alphaproteobacteria bacterium]|nr:hypothetical protein [Alphaproteobacteria bacterium]